MHSKEDLSNAIREGVYKGIKDYENEDNRSDVLGAVIFLVILIGMLILLLIKWIAASLMMNMWKVMVTVILITMLSHMCRFKGNGYLLKGSALIFQSAAIALATYRIYIFPWWKKGTIIL